MYLLSPLISTLKHGRRATTPKRQDTNVETQPTPQQSLPLRRRGPGRPSKSETMATFPNARPTGHLAVKLRRKHHNDSAMRSRSRFNTTLESMWKAIPRDERALQLREIDGNLDNSRDPCRALKVQVAIGYLRKLQAQVAGLDNGNESLF